MNANVVDMAERRFRALVGKRCSLRLPDGREIIGKVLSGLYGGGRRFCIRARESHYVLLTAARSLRPAPMSGNRKAPAMLGGTTRAGTSPTRSGPRRGHDQFGSARANVQGAHHDRIRSHCFEADPEQLGTLIRSANADSVGIAIAHGSVETPEVLKRIDAVEWRKRIAHATALGWHFVGCGRPWKHDGDGVFALARSLQELPEALTICNERISDHGSKATLWICFGPDEFRRSAYDALGAVAATEGSA